MSFEGLLSEEVFGFLLVFARLGSGIMLLPGFGEVYVAPRIRLFLAFAITIAVTPVVTGILPSMPEGTFEMAAVVVGEVIIGLFLGASVRLLASALHIAGMFISIQSALAAGQFFDPNQGQAGSLPGIFLSMFGILLIFVTGLHQPMLWALRDSYTVFPPGLALPTEDFAQLAVDIISGAFLIAFQIAAPIMVTSMLFYVSIGLIARLIPQIQVFFIGLPIQIALALFVLMTVLGVVMMWYLEYFEAGLVPFMSTE
ncbi:MAG: flagellar biosynthetic protein FliR [Proteobacteria bacterium]|nr:flagellar biosynthetic protein FliR [Pseudomonadota bacterium]